MIKKEWRQRMRKKRENYAYVQRDSLKMTEILRETELYQQARQIFAFVPFRNEPDFMALLVQAQQEGKETAVPQVLGDHVMVFRSAKNREQWKQSSLGIFEPGETEPVIEADGDTLILVPGLAFDRHGYRIGYGGGFYDAYLEKYPEAVTIGVAFDFQIVDEELPRQENDRRLDYILHTEGIEKVE